MDNQQSSGGPSVVKILLIIAGAGCLVMLLIGGGCMALFTKVAYDAAEETEKRKELAKSGPVSVVMWGELEPTYNLNSKATEMQKNELWKKYEGKKVKWSGKITSVREVFGAKIGLEVSMNPEASKTDVLVVLVESEREEAMKIKVGDTVTFTGLLEDWTDFIPVTLEYGEIVGN